jgi:hypothetical protein
VKSGDTRTTDEILQKFFMPYIALRNRKRGYAVSIVKAGMKIMGRSAGPVRPPLTDLTPAEMEDLSASSAPPLGQGELVWTSGLFSGLGRQSRGTRILRGWIFLPVAARSGGGSTSRLGHRPVIRERA